MGAESGDECSVKKIEIKKIGKRKPRRSTWSKNRLCGAAVGQEGR